MNTLLKAPRNRPLLTRPIQQMHPLSHIRLLTHTPLKARRKHPLRLSTAGPQPFVVQAGFVLLPFISIILASMLYSALGCMCAFLSVFESCVQPSCGCRWLSANGIRFLKAIPRCMVSLTFFLLGVFHVQICWIVGFILPICCILPFP